MEKRAHPRAEWKTRATMILPDDRFEVEISNVSLNGMFVELPSDRRVSLYIPVDIQVHDESYPEPICLQGQVVRHDNQGLGIHIELIELDASLQWRDLVRRAHRSIEEPVES
jgi:hypothetical protein